MQKKALYKVFEKFTDACSGDPYELTHTLYNRFVVDDDAYGDDMHYFGVLKYFEKTVIPHKIEVYKAGMDLAYELNLPVEIGKQFRSNLIIHDLSKFSANEAFGYAMYDFKNPKEESKKAFELSWHHHKVNNPHHPEYWLNPNRSGQLEVMQMPELFVFEMVADWIGAGVTYGNTLEKWLPENIHKFKWHVETAYTLKKVLGKLQIKVTLDPLNNILHGEANEGTILERPL